VRPGRLRHLTGRENGRVNRSDFAHFVTLPIQWGDMDSIGHVNNAIYFRYVESGRIAYFRAIEATPERGLFDGEGPILADIQCSFIGQLRYPDTIDIGTRTSRIGTKSFHIEAGIFVQGEDAPAAASKAVVVWFDYANQRTAPIPHELRERIIALEKVSPEGA
jgi:acyl-CoA thioester hydrolase